MGGEKWGAQKGILIMSDKSHQIAKKFIHWNARHPIPLVMLFCLVTGMLLGFLPTLPHQRGGAWGMMGSAGVLLVVWSVLLFRKKCPSWGHGVFWWGIGYFLRMGYILRFPYWQMQHDVGDFSMSDHHAGYILYLYNGGGLPDFDVREVWQFYHPPFHHLLCAVWMHLMHAVGMGEEQMYEAVQVLPCAYSCAALAIFGLILRHFKLEGWRFVMPLAVFAVHPSLIILGGSINNDMLCVLLMMASLLLTLRWFENPKYSTILGLALTIGLAMFTKLSGWLAAPAAACLFLLRFLWDKDDRKRLFTQFLGFGAVCVPIGLFIPVRNFVRFGVPLAYVPRIADDSEQYIGDISPLRRLLDFSPDQFRYIYDCFTMYGQDYNEYNPLIGLLKTAVFDEFINTDRFPAVAGFGEALFWTQVVLSGCALFSMIACLRQRERSAEKMALFLTYSITLLSYVSFCLTYPHTCTQSFRYAVPVLYTSLVFLGLHEPPKWGRVVEIAASVGFCGAALFVECALHATN